MSNPGASPIPNSDVGRLRLELGDTQYKELVPPMSGQVDYTYFSDAELEALVTGATVGGDVNWARAVAGGYRKLAATLALLAKNITADDLRIITESRAETMRKLAADYSADADRYDAALANDSFEIVSTGKRPPYGMEYAHGQGW